MGIDLDDFCSGSDERHQFRRWGFLVVVLMDGQHDGLPTAFREGIRDQPHPMNPHQIGGRPVRVDDQHGPLFQHIPNVGDMVGAC